MMQHCCIGVRGPNLNSVGVAGPLPDQGIIHYLPLTHIFPEGGFHGSTYLSLIFYLFCLLNVHLAVNHE